MRSTIRLGTRGSKLALCQSNNIADSLRSKGHHVDVIVLKTTGDVTSGPLQDFGGQGVFTQRLQTGLLSNEIDLAVHSLKDLPTDEVAGLKLGAVPRREDPRDALILPRGQKLGALEDLPLYCRIGTGSIRRKAQLLNLRPDLLVKDIRGNVDTRIKKLDDGDFDAIILACAGLNRLNLQDRISFIFDLEVLAPAVGQGALGLEVRDSDTSTLEAIVDLDCKHAHAQVLAERTMLNRLCAGCLAPVAAISSVIDSQLNVSGIALATDGSERIADKVHGNLEDAQQLGIQLANRLKLSGAEKFLH